MKKENIEKLNKHRFFWQDPAGETSRIVTIEDIYTEDEVETIEQLNELDEDTIILVDGSTEIPNCELFICDNVYEYAYDHVEHFGAMPVDMVRFLYADDLAEEYLLDFDGIVACLTDEQHSVLSAMIEEGE